MNSGSRLKKLHEISTKDITVTQGIDAVLDPGTLIHTLAVSKPKRDAFFASRPRAKKLLKIERKNPPLEEGAYQTSDIRDRDGELGIHAGAARILVDGWIKALKPENDGESCNTENCFVVDNNTEALDIILSRWIKNGDIDLKINFVDAYHHIAVYLRREPDGVKCLIIDPEPEYPVKEIRNTLKAVLPEASVALSKTPLELDYFSCSVFGLHCMKYFVKHGAEVFPHLANSRLTYNSEMDCAELHPDDLMPEIMKLVQGKVTLSDSALDSIASHKNHTTLREYLEQMKIQSGDKTYNAGAILKRYRYLERMEEYLKKNEILSAHTHVGMIQSLVSVCESNNDATLNAKEQSLLTTIQQKMPNFRRDFQSLFEKDDASELNKLRHFMFVTSYLESPDNKQVKAYLQFAQILFDLFGNAKDAFIYLQRHAQPGSRLPIHNACIFSLPDNQEKWDKTYWRKMAIKYGKPVTRLLPLASRLDLIREKQTKGTNQNNLIGKTELQRLQMYSAEISYKNAEQHPELAALCMKFNKSEQIFETCLEIVKTKLKTVSYLPGFTIHGKDIDARFSNFHMEKLPTGDLRGFFLGDFTNCCQNICGSADSVVMEGMCSPYVDFYVIYNDKNEIVAQLAAWISQDNKVVFDSWEPKVSEYNYLFQPFIKACAKPVMDAGFSGVRVGLGGRTPKDSKFDNATVASKPIQFGARYDAGRQMVVIDELFSQQELREKFLEFARQAPVPIAQFEYLLDYEDIDDAIIRNIDAMTLEQLLLLYRYFHVSETVRKFGSPIQNTIDFPFFYLLIQNANKYQLHDKIQAMMLRFLEEKLIDTLDLNNLHDYVNERVMPRSQFHRHRPGAIYYELDPTKLFTSFITFYANLCKLDGKQKYVQTLKEYAATMAQMCSLDEDPDRDVFEKTLLEISSKVLAHKDTPASIRSFVMAFVTQLADGREELVYELVAQNIDFMEIIHLVTSESLAPILRAALEKDDLHTINRLAAMMKKENITDDEFSVENLSFVCAIKGADASLTLIAIAKSSNETMKCFVDGFSNQEEFVRACACPLGFRLRFNEIKPGWQTIIGKFVWQENIEKLDAIRSLTKKDSSWHKMMTQRQDEVYKNEPLTALHQALKYQKFAAAAAIIRGYRKVENLHELLLMEDHDGNRPLDYITQDVVQAKPELVNMVVREISKAYGSSRKMLPELLDEKSDKTLACLLIPAKPKRVGMLFGTGKNMERPQHWHLHLNRNYRTRL